MYVPHAGGHAAGMERWRDAWLAPLLAALTSQDARLRANTAHYLLPLPLAMDSGSLPVLLARLHAVAAGDAGDGDASTGRVSCDATKAHGLARFFFFFFPVHSCAGTGMTHVAWQTGRLEHICIGCAIIPYL